MTLNQNPKNETPKGIDALNKQRADRDRRFVLREREAPPKRPDLRKGR